MIIIFFKSKKILLRGIVIVLIVVGCLLGMTFDASALKLKLKETEDNEFYEYATYIWDYLKEQEYNDYVCAGILGNMMVECGGYTLDLQVTIDSGSHYGICQWSKYYYPDVNGEELEEQCEFLVETIENTMSVFGGKNAFETFLNIENEKEAAKYFADYYERCGNASSESRQKCASIAYEYFVEE